MNSITNKDAKLIYSKYWNKKMGTLEFPTIYIDEYWEYTIDLFNLREDWERFLNEFYKEFDSAEQYIRESERVLSILKKHLFASDASQKMKEINIQNFHFKEICLYDIPVGDYWKIDLAKAFNQCFEYLGIINPGVTYESLINDITNSELIKTSKVLRLLLYESSKFIVNRRLYKICDEILYKLLQNDELKDKVKFEDILGIYGDALYIPKEKTILTLGDYTIDNIKIHIEETTVKSVNYKGSILKYTDTGKSTIFRRSSTDIVSIDEYLCIMKTIKNQQPNQIDLTVGHEDQIFYIMD